MTLAMFQGLWAAPTLNGPAILPSAKSPPRTRAPGRRVEGSPQALPRLLVSAPSQIALVTDCSSQSATHSPTFPTMSLTPQLETQAGLAPVFASEPVLPPTLQALESGVPATAICHSALVGSRLPELASARWAWNQVMLAAGATPATERAEMLVQSWPLGVQGIAPVIWLPPVGASQIDAS